MTPTRYPVPTVNHHSHHTFASPDLLHAWLQAHHASAPELWVRIYKKGTGTPSVTWDDCVLAGLTWGWIDGIRKGLDEVSFVQRMTPRRARSSWSQKNVQHAERLIAQGLMQAPGLAQVEAARADGRWASAYAGSADMVIPQDFLAAVQQDPAALAFYGTLKRQQLFTIYYRLTSAKRPETRERRMAEILATLGRGESL